MDSVAGMGMAPELPTVVRGRHRPVGLQHTPDDLTTVEGPHLIDDPTGFARLQPQHALGEDPQVEPDCDREACKSQQHSKSEERPHGALMTGGSLTLTLHGRLGAWEPTWLYTDRVYLG